MVERVAGYCVRGQSLLPWFLHYPHTYPIALYILVVLIDTKGLLMFVSISLPRRTDIRMAALVAMPFPCHPKPMLELWHELIRLDQYM